MTRSILSCSVLLVCIGFASLASAQTSSASFAYPPPETTAAPRLTINVFDTVNLEWASNFDKAWLYLWCDGVTSAGARTAVKWLQQQVNVSGMTDYSPSIQSDTSQDWSSPWACHFDLVYLQDGNKGIRGPNLNITSMRGKAATTYDRQATIVTTTQTPTVIRPSQIFSENPFITAVTASAQFTTLQPAASQQPPITSAPTKHASGLSIGAKAGIALGVLVFVIIVLALILVLLRKRRRNQNTPPATHSSEPHGDASKPPTYNATYPVGKHEADPSGALVELDGTQTYELPAGSRETGVLEKHDRGVNASQ